MVHLSRQVGSATAAELVEEYWDKMKTVMNVGEKCYLLVEAHRAFHRTVHPETVK